MPLPYPRQRARQSAGAGCLLARREEAEARQRAGHFSARRGGVDVRAHRAQHAVARAEELGRPLLVYEGLSASYRWASDRFHAFVLEGMRANAAAYSSNPISGLTATACVAN